MIKVEGYKAFRGTMLITPVAGAGIEPFNAYGDWLYRPEHDCWYCNGRSFPARICTIIEEVTHEKTDA